MKCLPINFSLDDIVDAKVEALSQIADDKFGLNVAFITGQFSIKTSDEIDAVDDKEGDSGGDFTDSFNAHKRHREAFVHK
ncbi:uncharacterized protein N7484_011483 [Penicillium longicatenatum]|uniref:uncharacterized protein n=1 Tax=Penicillium longicatenatum TaxID=1561947 RepID=UPI002546BE1D|nr:uncharacterized protein N7484_011483 [Penicillium longicatenatum]KAJ5631383.1 hypothetical protein N7484_011483 [Penicillium longicatenatum]